MRIMDFVLPNAHIYKDVGEPIIYGILKESILDIKSNFIVDKNRSQIWTLRFGFWEDGSPRIGSSSARGMGESRSSTMSRDAKWWHVSRAPVPGCLKQQRRQENSAFMYYIYSLIRLLFLTSLSLL
jgi:hypothetical protein